MTKHKPRPQPGRRTPPEDTAPMTLAELGVAEEMERLSGPGEEDKGTTDSPFCVP